MPSYRPLQKDAFKLKDDPRIIPIAGRFLRWFSIDELPQLWSVVRGDMSLVGPRHFPDYHLDALSPHARRLRDEVRPGILGLWQIMARGEAGVEAQQAFDMYYIRNWSPWLDLHILARTAAVVLSGRGAKDHTGARRSLRHARGSRPCSLRSESMELFDVGRRFYGPRRVVPASRVLSSSWRLPARPGRA